MPFSNALGSAWSSPDPIIAAALALHVAAGDPHTGYQRESEKDAASGYAGLSAGSKIAIGQIPTGTSGSTVALGNAPATAQAAAEATAAAALAAHVAAADPHPGYETTAEGTTKANAAQAAAEATAATALATHVAAADPHTGYQKESERNAVSGYAGLDSASRIALAQTYTGSLAAFGLYGDGSDGVVAFDGTNTFAAFATTTGAAPNLAYTLIRDIYATTLSISTGKNVRTAGFVVYHTGTFTNAGTLHNDGSPGVNGIGATHVAQEGTLQSVRAGGGNGATTSLAQTVAGSAGTNSGGRNVTGNNGGAGGAGGGGGGGAAGTGGVPTAIQGSLQSGRFATASRLYDGTGANGGGGAGGGGGTSTTGSSQGGGGGGSAGGVKVVGRAYDGTGGLISAIGGAGAAGAQTGDGIAGGGGGGNGGFLHLWWGIIIAAGSTSVAAGSGGAGANGGSAGSNGGVGKAVVLVAA